MKKTLTLIAAVAFINSVASAELLKNFQHKGTIEVNAYNINNADFDKDNDDKEGDVDTRFMLDLTFDFNNDVSGVVSIVKNNRQWGTGSEDLNTIKNNLFVEQAYLNLKGVMGMDHKIGRQYYGNPNDLVIYYGPKMWPYMTNMPVDALDAWTGVYKYKDWTFTGLLGKINRNNNNMGENLSGIDIKTKLDRFNLNAYYYYKVDNTQTPAADKIGLFGLRANWECMFLKDLILGIEANKNTDTNQNHKEYKGYAYKLNADYKFDLAGKLALMAEYAYLSGQDSSTDIKEYTSINDDYRPGIIKGGGRLNNNYVNNIGTGYKGLHFGANWTPSALEKLNIAATYYNMKVAEKNSGYKDTIGNEVDIVATWNHSENVSLKGYYAMFMPEKDNVAKDDAQTAIGAAFVVKF